MVAIIVVCHNLLSCGIYTALVSLVLGTAIPTSLSILIKKTLYINQSIKYIMVYVVMKPFTLTDFKCNQH